MLDMINILLPLKKTFSIRLIKIYSLTLCVFLIAKTDGYACNNLYAGHIKFHNQTDIPIDIVVSHTKEEEGTQGKCLRKNSKTKECELRSNSEFESVIKKIVTDKNITVPAKTTSDGQCWVESASSYDKLSYFKTSFEYNGETVLGPAGAVDVYTPYFSFNATGRVRKNEGNQEYIISSGCKDKHKICTVDLKFKKKK